MRTLNKKAYDMLMEDEKLALGLHIGMNKSTWQSGEIMKKSHYKYLEIQYRAKRFFQLFTEHLDLYPEVIPDYVDGQKYVLEYLRQCIEFRLKPYQAVEKVREKNPKVTKAMINEKLIEVVNHWKKTSEQNPYNGSVLHLVMDFDRWNNFRILPKEVQEPSSFKRRIKKAYLKNLKVLKQIPDISIEKIIKLFSTRSNNCYYWPHLEKNLPKVTKVKTIPASLKVLNSLSLYIFKNKEDATEYITICFHYLMKDGRDCKDGLEFWPKYRDLIKKAHNYEEIQNIIPQRKYLDLALQNLQFI